MKISKEFLKQMIDDILVWNEYSKYMKKSNSKNKHQTFKEMFGYEILIFEDGNIEIKGQRK